MTLPESLKRQERVISIPEGLDQERVDAALARMLGLSRSVVVDLIESGEISKSGKVVTKSDKVSTGDVLEILMPAAKMPPTLTATPIEGLDVVFNDEHIIVINKPSGKSYALSFSFLNSESPSTKKILEVLIFKRIELFSLDENDAAN